MVIESDDLVGAPNSDGRTERLHRVAAGYYEQFAERKADLTALERVRSLAIPGVVIPDSAVTAYREEVSAAQAAFETSSKAAQSAG